VEGEEIPVLRVDAVGSKSAAETVATIVHKGDRLDDDLSSYQFPGAGDEPGEAAVGDLFFEYVGRLPFH
jgi:hypothetical protein